MLTRSSSFPGTSGSLSQEATGCASLISSRKLNVTLLSSEWGSTKGGLSTINRELAIQLAKNNNVKVSMYLPCYSEEDKRAASGFSVCLLKAKKKPGYDPIDWLASIPKGHCMDVVIGHGVHLGRQVPMIKELHPKCKWIQVVHTDPEELGMFKDYADPTVKGEKKHQAEVELCKLADQVVAVGPKLTEAFACYLRSCGKDQNVINLTPGIFSEFANINQAAEERETFRVLVFGRGDSEDFLVKGYDIAAHAVAKLKNEERSFKLVFVGAPNGEEEKVKGRFLKEGISPSQLIVRSAKEREQLGEEFCQADLVIMPSRTEGFGLAALEGLSAGLPVLVSSNSGIGKALKKVPNGSNYVVNSEFNNDDPVKWAEAIKAICRKERKVRLKDAILLRQYYAETYQWEGQCSTLVEKMLQMIKVTSAVSDQAVAAVSLGEQGSSSILEAVFHPDRTTAQQHIVGDVVNSGRENESHGKGPLNPMAMTFPQKRRPNTDIPEMVANKRRTGGLNCSETITCGMPAARGINGERPPRSRRGEQSTSETPRHPRNRSSSFMASQSQNAHQIQLGPLCPASSNPPPCHPYSSTFKTHPPNVSSQAAPPPLSSVQPSAAPGTGQSGLPPLPYYLVALPKNVRKCYGCRKVFAEKYRQPPYNIVVKHLDQRVMGKDSNSGALLYARDFTNTYYHLNPSHIKRKNPFFDGRVLIDPDTYESLNEDQRKVLKKHGLKVIIDNS
ncbi:PREDICTED: uncharacterized protein LOC107349844 isoform X3 [Acropora digitifera]|uniref:uncharacterized protein LOC107349844 isoform X3 n=1 Tax=Acropora digitifera TaxID=70779 RepID=UPI00077B16B5|nr:PREDICTED: uncharacterized protein LOC107349844 isoform X3 [Acropora digitifera]